MDDAKHQPGIPLGRNRQQFRAAERAANRGDHRDQAGIELVQLGDDDVGRRLERAPGHGAFAGHLAGDAPAGLGFDQPPQAATDLGAVA